MFNDMNDIRFLTCVRNDNYSCCDTLSTLVLLISIDRPLRLTDNNPVKKQYVIIS